MKRLEGKITVITGGAGGIGEATARLFVDEGARVVIADIQDDQGARLAKELGEAADFFHTDVTRESNVQAVVAHAVEKFGRLDCLCSNAAIASGGSRPIQEIDLATLEGSDFGNSSTNLPESSASIPAP